MFSRSPIVLSLFAFATLMFLLVPLAVVVLYAFSSDDAGFVFPPPAFTLNWFAVAWLREDVWRALILSIEVALLSTLVAMVLGTCAAAGLARKNFYGNNGLMLLLILPIALPGIVSGIALRTSIKSLGFDFNFWTIAVGHATFCMIIVYNNVVARLRRISPSLAEASADLGASPFQTLRYVVFPQMASALLAGCLLAFALSFDEIIVTTFTAGQQTTLPIWMFQQLSKPRDRPVTNVVAVVVMALTFIPIALAYWLGRPRDSQTNR